MNQNVHTLTQLKTARGGEGVRDREDYGSGLAVANGHAAADNLLSRLVDGWLRCGRVKGDRSPRWIACGTAEGEDEESCESHHHTLKRCFESRTVEGATTCETRTAVPMILWVSVIKKP